MQSANRTTRIARAACALAAAAALAATATPAQADPAWGLTSQVDVGVNGARPDHQSTALGVSADGRYALFSSEATNLLPGTGTGTITFGLYVRDLRNGRTELVSLADDGTPLAGVGEAAGISGDGRYVVFSSGAANAVPGQPAKGWGNVYVRDRATGHTQLVTAGTASGGDQTRNGAWAPSISADGQYVAYMSTRTDLVPGAATKPDARNVYVTDRSTGTTRLVTTGADGNPASADSGNAVISADGSTVGFSSKASNLIPPAQGAPDAELLRLRYTSLYTYDLDSGRTTLASLDATGGSGSAAPAIRLSPDGRYAVYALGATPLPGGKARTELFIHDLWTDDVKSIRTSANPAAVCWADPSAAITADDQWIYFSGGCSDTVIPANKARYDLYRQDLTTGHTEPISTAPDSAEENGSAYGPFPADDGATVVFTSTSTNLVPGSSGTGSGSWQVYARTLSDD
ncbi:hypothetical protein KV557_10775 [Kitasatospora aureofaciens]|uniref:hypothetical protein n=1 Tax=Kitasatospora aureofaciens TaxID=1894 RepID=UPI001C47E1AA|nr:hypothetical protein [Kitasatospora aureofaciens]MBV6697610.1 hypothetical protein [Kitasatospora aureofaciens]